MSHSPISPAFLTLPNVKLARGIQYLGFTQRPGRFDFYSVPQSGGTNKVGARLRHVGSLTGYESRTHVVDSRFGDGRLGIACAGSAVELNGPFTSGTYAPVPALPFTVLGLAWQESSYSPYFRSIWASICSNGGPGIGGFNAKTSVYSQTGSRWYSSSTNWNDSAWHVVGYTITASGQITFYLDGVADGTATGFGGFWSGAYNWHFGGEGIFDPAADKMRFSVGYCWNRELSPGEVAAVSRDPWFAFNRATRTFSLPPSTSQSLEGDTTEGGLLGDALVGQVVCNKSITEGIILGETKSATLLAPLSIGESALAGDSKSVAATFTRGNTEGLLVGDTNNSIMTAVSSIIEGLLAGDSSVGYKTTVAYISEGSILGDATDSLIAIGVSLNEGLILGDSRSSQAAYQASLTEGGILGDTRTVTGSLLFSITEGAVAGDNVSGAAQRYASLTEGGLLGDSSPAVTFLAACFIVEGGAVGDSSAVSAQMRNSIVEEGILGDSKTVVVSFSVAISEGSITGDTEAVMRTVYASLSEGGITGDSANSIAAFASSIVEGVLVGETENAVTTYVVYVSEGGLLGEELEVIKRTFSRSYNIPLPHEPIKVADLIKQVKATKIMPSSAKAADKIIVVKPIKLSDAPPPTKKSAAPPPERKRSTQDND